MARERIPLVVAFKEFEFYVDFLMLNVLTESNEVYVKGLGSNVIKAVEVFNCASKRFERMPSTNVELKYGRIDLGELEMEDYRIKPTIGIPCRNVSDETKGYRSVGDLDRNPWPDDSFMVPYYWREPAEHLSQIFTKKRKMNLVGIGLNIRNAISACNLIRKDAEQVGVGVRYDAELGSRVRHGDMYKCGIKIGLTAKEN